MSNVIERFGQAVRVLVGDGAMKQRLSAAYGEHLAEIDGSEVPAAVRSRFIDLHAALNRVSPVGKESRVKASVQKMSFGEAAGHACTILELYQAVLIANERAEPLKVVNNRAPRSRSTTAAKGSTDAADVPAYLTGSR